MASSMAQPADSILNAKQRLVQRLIRLLKTLLGNDNALDIMKAIVRRLPEPYAFAATWVCLWEFPPGSVSESKWLYGYPRSAPNMRVRVNPACESGRFFATSGFYEDFLTREMLSPTRSGLLVDIGANYGYYPILWLQKPNTRVIAVEPVDEYVKLLHENLGRFGDRYQVFQACVGDYEGTALLDTGAAETPTMLSKVVPAGSQGKTVREVPMITLASLLEKYHETTIDVLKIDAEGYDTKILHSCRSLFEAKVIRTVFWETARTEEELAIAQFLEGLGYHRIMAGIVTGYEL